MKKRKKGILLLLVLCVTAALMQPLADASAASFEEKIKQSQERKEELEQLLQDAEKRKEDYEKHKQEMQATLEQLQKELSRLKMKLIDVQLQVDTNVDFDIVIKGMDYFKDNIFIDGAILSKIKQSQSEMKNLGSQIESILIRLNTMLTRNRQAQKQLKEELDRLVQGIQK